MAVKLLLFLLQMFVFMVFSFDGHPMDDDGNPKSTAYWKVVRDFDDPNISDLDLPSEFDVRTNPDNPPLCKAVMEDIPRQSRRCGNCYAIVSAVAFGQRYCRLTKGVFHSVLSSLHITRCLSLKKNGCTASNTAAVCQQLHKMGIVSGTTSSAHPKIGCLPDDTPVCTKDDWADICPVDSKEKLDAGECRGDECHNGSHASEEGLNMTETGYCTTHYKKDLTSRGRMKLLRSKGAIITSICGKYIKDYSGHGVIDFDVPGCKDDHYVIIVGWGHYGKERKLFWRALNSWGPQWGKSGTFKIEAGRNLLKSEFAWILPIFKRETPVPRRITRKIYIDGHVHHCFSTHGGQACENGTFADSTAIVKVIYACFPSTSSVVKALRSNDDMHLPLHHHHSIVEKYQRLPYSCTKA